MWLYQLLLPPSERLPAPSSPSLSSCLSLPIVPQRSVHQPVQVSMHYLGPTELSSASGHNTSASIGTFFSSDAVHSSSRPRRRQLQYNTDTQRYRSHYVERERERGRQKDLLCCLFFSFPDYPFLSLPDKRTIAHSHKSTLTQNHNSSEL